MEICMSAKPDLATMSKVELRTYVLEHRGDEEALHAYLDRLHAENPSSQKYRPDDDVAEAIAEHMKHRTPKEA
jgi:hypothetical protein